MVKDGGKTQRNVIASRRIANEGNNEPGGEERLKSDEKELDAITRRNNNPRFIYGLFERKNMEEGEIIKF